MNLAEIEHTESIVDYCLARKWVLLVFLLTLVILAAASIYQSQPVQLKSLELTLMTQPDIKQNDIETAIDRMRSLWVISLVSGCFLIVIKTLVYSWIVKVVLSLVFKIETTYRDAFLFIVVSQLCWQALNVISVLVLYRMDVLGNATKPYQLVGYLNILRLVQPESVLLRSLFACISIWEVAWWFASVLLMSKILKVSTKTSIACFVCTAGPFFLAAVYISKNMFAQM